MRTLVAGAALLCCGLRLTAQTLQGYQAEPGEVRFAVAANGPLPATQAVVVASSLPSPTQLDATLDGGSATTPAPDWIAAGPRLTVTPARIVVSVTRTNLRAGTYSARLLIRTRASIVTRILATVPITLEVTERPASLELIPEALRVLVRPRKPIPERVIFLRNNGPGGLDCGRVVATPSDPWLSARAETAPIGCRLRVQVNGANLRVGAYAASIRISTGIGEVEAPVGVFVARAGPVLDVNPNGFQFQARQDNGNAIRRNLAVLNKGDGTLNWTAQIVSPEESTWLTIEAASGTAAPDAAGTIPITVNPDGLAPRDYSALIQVSSANAANSPQLFSVVFRVKPATDPPDGTPSPSGLLFTVTARSGASAAQVVSVFTSSRTPISFHAAAQTSDGANWLAIQPSTGTMFTTSPARVSVTVNPGTLAAGFYQGEVNTVAIVAGTLQVRSVNVAMLVRPAAVASLVDESKSPEQGACTPSRLSATHTGLVNSFSTNVGWPTPLNVRLTNDCGALVPDGQVVLSFSNGDSPMALTDLDNGNYTGTWVPRNTAEGSLTIQAEAIAGALRASLDLTGSVKANAAPIVAPGGVLNNLYARVGGPLAPGMIVAIFGSQLAGGQAQPPLAGGRLPDSFNNVTVLIGSVRAPLYFLSPGQINAQMPFELRPDQQYPVVVRVGAGLSVPETISVASVQPGILAFADGRVIAQDENFGLITDANPARRGRPIVIYLVGMGATTPVVSTGAQSPGDTLATVAEEPRVTIDGKTARLLFAGLTPGLVALYQINTEVPQDAAAGLRPLVVNQGAASGNSVMIPVQ